ncbi:hypothetical protein EIKCOROL_01665 [Eikenella corrodens ATCC 23834]|uniref:Uncharacterized protein n=1 Tax=Eikenella corrodens ATCC 23834 TaxID=546274 RepID=C0DWB4_EIKCO|nr:hypothetical protein EIKCOROL_01665 [Eikenella corrodens ATCC 23834]
MPFDKSYQVLSYQFPFPIRHGSHLFKLASYVCRLSNLQVAPSRL